MSRKIEEKMALAESFGLLVKQYRKALALTQHELAQRTQCAVVTIQKIEAEQRRPSRQIAERLADELVIPTEERATFMQAARYLSASTKESLALLHKSFPVSSSPLLGRSKDLAALRALLRQTHVRLVTVIGSPGVGKTRLAMQMAEESATNFVDGVRFVTLAPIQDASLVVPALAQVLDVRESKQQSLLDALLAYLRPKQMLLVLDNFEHILTATPFIARLLEHAPQLKLLVTSRVVLRLSAEHEFIVSPLALPNLDPLPTWEQLMGYAAINLFAARAQAVKASFALTEANAPVVAKICVCLDGLPLAIQLAAARIKLLTPQALLRRLDQRLPLLTSGAVDVAARHQTLRGAIAWSYELLPPDEQTLFRRLGIFVGGCTLEAVEAICVDGISPTGGEAWKIQAPKRQNTGVNSQAILDKLTALVDKSLLQPMVNDDDEPHFMLLETLREYALEQLAAHGEQATIQQRYTAYYLALAEAAEPELNGPHQGLWFAQLELEFNNIRATVRWALDQKEMTTVARLVGALNLFWQSSRHWREARQWLGAVLAIPHTLPLVVHVKSRYYAAVLECFQGDFRQAQTLLQENLALARTLDDQRWTAKTLSMLGGVTEELNGHTQAVIFYEESLALSRVLENQWDIAAVLCNLGYVIALRGNYTRAITYLEESLALSRKVDDKDGIADALTKLGMVHHFLGDYQKANTLLKEGLALAREVGDKWLVAIALQFLSDVSLNQGNNAQALALSEQGLIYEREIENKNNIARLHRILGVVWLHQGEHAQASEFLRKSLALAWEIEDKVVTTESLEALAEAAIKQEQPRRAAQLCGAAEALRTAIHTPLPPGRYLPYDRTISAARTQLGEAAFNIAWAEGRTLSLEQIIAKALVPAPMPEPTPIVATTAQPTYPAGLTKREVEVLSLIAAGFTTAQVAEQIVISPRTVSSHLESIYSKLGVHSRSAATRFATEHGLV